MAFWSEYLQAPLEGYRSLAEAPHLLALVAAARRAQGALASLEAPPLEAPEGVEALGDLLEEPFPLVRGGGEGLEALDKPEVWEAVAACPKPVVVALGHAANTLWVETLADQAFPTPTAFGSFLRDVVRAVEREKESAKLAVFGDHELLFGLDRLDELMDVSISDMDLSIVMGGSS